MAATRLAWICGTCQRECIPIRSESRCLCGHRHKEHDPGGARRCTAGKCACSGFFYIVAEGAWILRCRCKHKHVEHAADTHACAKAGCACRRFDSPWVCNCDHPWADHKQVEVEKAVGCGLLEAIADVNRWDQLKRGGGAGGG
ncbi:hypothetical protein CHLNCDRAFT_138771 [Chlorella variabilis]|uniref:Protein FAM221A n=1 Tax=Chlorella variabilis TaxID=554065 RepID=E1ZNQ3_CHLVA|nr:hypothetical protein CHLNCDRAFT_138771 [Chlorella variabilis]EFN52456.1 hypothetical protein CHLNCDRAFT_138771 [Chlorella variabilis]|eukprot:XP_005844558.1 hypothetical protein CHLNCDRAFT_138771 [Chlorella variabilis]